MRRVLADYRLFLNEFRRSFHTTGAILPSSPMLARALARYVATGGAPSDTFDNAKPSAAGSTGRKILEVGPGTGAVTRQIVRAMSPDDQLALVEINDQFVERLRRKFREDPALQPVWDRTTIHQKMIQDLDAVDRYDLAISGLPLNNFSADDVEAILAKIQTLLRPGGVLSFFEYIAVRPLRRTIAGKSEKQRLRGIGHALKTLLDQHEFHRQSIWINAPPAWVHHVRFD